MYLLFSFFSGSIIIIELCGENMSLFPPACSERKVGRWVGGCRRASGFFVMTYTASPVVYTDRLLMYCHGVGKSVMIVEEECRYIYDMAYFSFITRFQGAQHVVL